ncbi:hypothetical protein IE53DRAFT_383095 [Violaceomyces palustris]|uniref:Uncharacterized protein n=1 Tax=Violaceomyces palustris TaxID=1673888 RepID=A0ACD0P8K0_9BASI|nr:hypothetical protein IE53DRAFT_383095 [Violaceomyces palustris]
MAFLPTFVRYASKRPVDGILQQFLESNANRASSSMPNPFLPHKNPVSGRWHPPKFSLRRQAKLVSLACQSRILRELPDGPKVSRAIARIRGIKERRILDKAAADVDLAAIAKVMPPSARPKKLAEDEEVMKTARMVGYQGPYLGRKQKKMFKGSKVDREAYQRRQDVKAKLERMDVTIKEWQASKAETKAKSKPALPF